MMVYQINLVRRTNAVLEGDMEVAQPKREGGRVMEDLQWDSSQVTELWICQGECWAGGQHLAAYSTKTKPVSVFLILHCL